MRLASHVLAVFLAISTVASPCLASIKAGQDASRNHQQPVQSLPDGRNDGGNSVLARNITTEITDEIQGVCNGPCARLMSMRNIQSLRGDVVREFAGIVPVTFFVSPEKFSNPPATRPLVSQTQWNSVDIYHLCRQLN